MENKLDWLKPADYLSGSVFVAVMLFFSILGCLAQAGGNEAVHHPGHPRRDRGR
ncbi:hypothetical protein [uncultured Lactobacillus sp.]|uniref:hypothetical protein n=1 Tax=uncultured Lactobacillus sp. TaxID=153152 RepID=UPI002665777F|nr:hypothetical protein [uncultured Lactobacillus sp.]